MSQLVLVYFIFCLLMQQRKSFSTHVTERGEPQLFITKTWRTQCTEVMEESYPDQSPHDRNELIPVKF